MAHGDITHTEIPVTDFARATAFYSELFGWKIADIPGFEEYPMWEGPGGFGGGALTPRTEGFTQPRSIVEVDSIEETVEKAVASGGSVKLPRSAITDTSWWAIIVDPDGNELGLFEGSLA